MRRSNENIVRSKYVAKDDNISMEGYYNDPISKNSNLVDDQENIDDTRVVVGSTVEICPPPGYTSKFSRGIVVSKNDKESTVMPDGFDRTVVVPTRLLRRITEREKNSFSYGLKMKDDGRGEERELEEILVNVLSKDRGTLLPSSSSLSRIGETNATPNTGADSRYGEVFTKMLNKNEDKEIENSEALEKISMVQGIHSFANKEGYKQIQEQDKYLPHKIEAAAHYNKINEDGSVTKEVNGQENIVLPPSNIAVSIAKDATDNPMEEINPDAYAPKERELDDILDSIITPGKLNKETGKTTVTELDEQGRINSGIFLSKETHAPTFRKEDSLFSEDITGEYSDMVEEAKENASVIVTAQIQDKDITQELDKMNSNPAVGIISSNFVSDLNKDKVHGACMNSLNKIITDFTNFSLVGTPNLNIIKTSSIGKEKKGEVALSGLMYSLEHNMVIPTIVLFNYSDTKMGTAKFAGAVMYAGQDNSLIVELEKFNEEEAIEKINQAQNKEEV
jgi:polyhydroxyalkanoate synthesis regulator phasin